MIDVNGSAVRDTQDEPRTTSRGRARLQSPAAARGAAVIRVDDRWVDVE